MKELDTETWWTNFFNGDFTEVVLNQQAKETLDFFRKVADIQSGMNVFDQCCGKGYLTDELVKAGLYATGIDMSESYIRYAREKLASPMTKFILGDAKTFIQPESFDICINWNTSFAYNTDDTENEKMLKAFAKNLKPSGQFFISTMNPLYINKHFQRFIVKQIPHEDSTIITIRESRIENDMMKSDWLIIYPDGTRQTAYGQTKLYTLAQFEIMLNKHGLTIDKVFGDINCGTYDDNHPSMIIYGHKQE